MSSYAVLEDLLRNLATVCDEMVSRDPRLQGLAEDVRGEIEQISYDLEGAPDRPLSPADSALVQGVVEALQPLLLELQVASVPPGFTGVGAVQSAEILHRFRNPIRRLQTALRAED